MPKLFFILLMSCILLSADNSAKLVQEMKQIQEDIRLLNLVNGLDLSKEQIKFIIDKAREAAVVQQEFEGKLTEDQEIITRTFEELRDNRMQGKEIDEALRNRFFKVEGRIKDWKQEMDDELEQISLEVKEKLDGHQVFQLESYVPCLIPPPGQARIGQSEEAVGLEKMLETIREMPERAYGSRKDDIADKTIERMKQHLPKGYVFDEKRERACIMAILDETRDLSDVDFELKKAELAKKLKSRGSIPKLPIDVSAKIEQFLLNPSIIPLLQEKLRRM